MRDGCQRHINSHGPKCLFVVVYKIVKGTMAGILLKNIYNALQCVAYNKKYPSFAENRCARRGQFHVNKNYNY